MGPEISGQATTELANGIMAQLTGTGSIDFDAIGKILISLEVCIFSVLHWQVYRDG